MPIATNLMQSLAISHPIIQAPLAGGGDTPELVAAVCNAGALGFVGAAYLAPAQIRDVAQRTRAQTSRPYGINLFAPGAAPGMPDNVAAALAQIAPYFAELGLPPPETPAPAADAFDEQLRAALDSGAAVFSFTMGLLPHDAVAAIKRRGMILIGTATTPSEAQALDQIGVDAVVAQGSEAGGHRATFAADFETGLIGTMALVPQIIDKVRVPVIASGGIMDGRGIVAALALGADAVQMGTAFLTTQESGVAEAYKQAIVAASGSETRVTRAFSGRPARGIVNRFMREVDGAAADAILPFPLQNALTRPLRIAAARQGRAEFLSLWAGQGLELARRLSAGGLIARLAEETEAALGRLARSR